MDNIFKEYKIKEKVKKNGGERADLISKIYEFYKNDGQNRRKENWRRFCVWCRENKKSKNEIELFKKTKFYLKELPVNKIAILLSHIPTKDLYYIKSNCFDKFQRGEDVGKYILGSIKCVHNFKILISSQNPTI